MSNDNHSSIFIIGAAKCGTTALADLLDRHPDIELSEPKESDFFSDRVFVRGFEWYESCYGRKPGANYRLDASVSYSIGWGENGSDSIAKRIYERDNNAIIIYIVRDPVQRAWASYWHDVRNMNADTNIRPEQSILEPNSAHLKGGMYYQRLSEYLKYFSKDKILVLHQQQLKNNPAEVLKMINQLVQLESLEKLADLEQKSVNSSYQFNAAGRLITKVVPIEFIKRLAHFSNRCLPSFVNRMIRERISNPIPQIGPELSKKLVSLYEADAKLLFDDFGIDVRNGSWWTGDNNQGV